MEEKNKRELSWGFLTVEHFKTTKNIPSNVRFACIKSEDFAIYRRVDGTEDTPGIYREIVTYNGARFRRMPKAIGVKASLKAMEWYWSDLKASKLVGSNK